jgi:hypothetical protein
VGLGRISSALLAPYVEGWPPMDRDDVEAPKSAGESAQATLAKIERMGLITRDLDQAHPATPNLTTPAARTLVPADLEERPIVKWRFGLRVLQACTAAAWDLRLCRFEQVVSRLRGRNTELSVTAAGCDQQTLFSVVERYVYARPLFFSARNACLYDSRTLLELLYYHRVVPTWILIDTVENVSRFTPILAI